MVQQLEFGVEVVNTGTSAIALSSVAVRYWYTEDATGTQQTACGLAAVGCGAVSLSVHPVSPARATSDAYVEIAFTGVTMLAPGASSGEVRLSITKTSATPFNQGNDYSFRSTGASYLDAPTVTAYIGGRLAWGTEPP
jgi:hypothetical protein